MPIDIYQTQTLAEVIKSTPEVPTFLRDLLFKKTKTFATESVMIDVKKGRRTVTPFVSPFSTAPVTQRNGYNTRIYTPAIKKEKRPITPQELDVRLAGEQPFNSGVTPAERALNLLADDTQDLKDNIVRAQEVMAADLLFTGQLHIKGTNVNDTVDFGFTNTETLASTTRWGQSAANITADIVRWQKQCLKKSGYKPNVMIMNSETFDVLLKDPTILKLLDNRNTDFGMLKAQELGEGATYQGYLAGSLGINVYTYDNWYIDPADNTEKSLVPDKYICLASDRGIFSKLYGGITLIDGEGAEGQFSTYEAEYVLRRLIQRDPDAMYLELQSRPLLVPDDVDSFFTASVL